MIDAPAKEVAPPGWEDNVKQMKSHPEIDNPWALAWSMADQGADPKHEADYLKANSAFKASENYEAYCEKYPAPAKEANSSATLGQLTRPQNKPVDQYESVRGQMVLGVRLLEAESGIVEGNREVGVIIIKEGMGNKADKHFYSAELLTRVAHLFDGIKAYANHPSKNEEVDRPERDVREIVGYYHSPRVIVVEGRTVIAATLKIISGSAYDWAWNLVKESVAFSKKFSDKDLVGISINAWGTSHETVDIHGAAINMVDDLAEVQSADIVTQAGAGGGFRLREAIKKVLAREENKPGGNNMNELMTKHGEGLKALHDQIKANPDHAKMYGPTMEALIAHHAEMMKAPADAAPAEEPKAEEPKKEEPPKEEPKMESSKPGEETFEQMTERYMAGKMLPSEKRVYEVLANDRAEARIKANIAMIEKTIKESGIPAAYAEDLTVLCAGRPEADVKKLVESRKKLVAPLIGDKGQGAGAGGSSDAKPASKLSEKLASSGVKMVAVK